MVLTRGAARPERQRSRNVHKKVRSGLAMRCRREGGLWSSVKNSTVITVGQHPFYDTGQAGPF